MSNENTNNIEKKLGVIVELLQNLLALELSKSGVEQSIIGKRLHVAKARVVEMLKGVKKDK